LGQFQKLVGFVPQEDVMIRELSVRDNIEFSARYRLPKELTPDEINSKVNVCINELGITHVQHSPIGDERTRGVSGGQRKRLSLAKALILEPDILLLDEPDTYMHPKLIKSFICLLQSDHLDCLNCKI
jgi:ABC-type multidrug transport system ATPase subunit